MINVLIDSMDGMSFDEARFLNYSHTSSYLHSSSRFLSNSGGEVDVPGVSRVNLPSKFSRSSKDESESSSSSSESLTATSLPS